MRYFKPPERAAGTSCGTIADLMSDPPGLNKPPAHFPVPTLVLMGHACLPTRVEYTQAYTQTHVFPVLHPVLYVFHALYATCLHVVSHYPPAAGNICVLVHPVVCLFTAENQFYVGSCSLTLTLRPPRDLKYSVLFMGHL